MLNFVLWGIALNLYSCAVVWLICKAIYPKGYKSPYGKKYPLMLRIALMLMPYFYFILSLLVIFILAVFRFDYKEIEELRAHIREKERAIRENK